MYQVMNGIDSAMNAVGGFVDQIVHNPSLLLIPLVIALAVYLGPKLLRKRRQKGKDDQRLFTPAQKLEAKRRAGGRCEASTLGFRCRRPGEHADHIYPHSKGGQTTMSNCQSLCAPHNLRKSAQVPSRFYIRRLVARRAAYFPAGVNPGVEWRAGRAW